MPETLLSMWVCFGLCYFVRPVCGTVMMVYSYEVHMYCLWCAAWAVCRAEGTHRASKAVVPSAENRGWGQSGVVSIIVENRGDKLVAIFPPWVAPSLGARAAAHAQASCIHTILLATGLPSLIRVRGHASTSGRRRMFHSLSRQL